MKTVLCLRLVLIFSILTIFFSCRKDEDILTDSSAKLEFSTDSIRFDTVFVAVGSTTKYFQVRNKNNGPVKISNVRLARGASSPYTLNVDGVPGKLIKDVSIAEKDSIYVFVEVTVDPNNQNNPFVVKDSILFELNGNTQWVVLESWGQNAYYHVPSSGFYFNLNCNEIWKNDKPHVIYGGAIVPPGCKLTIQDGVNVHVHAYSLLAVDSGGTLDIKGKIGSEVVFQGDRLEPEYKDIPGQWGTIWLSAMSVNNKIDWAIIKNGGIGLLVDTVGNSSNPTLAISNTIVKNMATNGLFGRGSKITAVNCVFANCGSSAVALGYGGKYWFKHCTIANYYKSSTTQARSNPALLLNNWYETESKQVISRPLDSAYFANCIIYGDLDNELGLDSSGGGAFNYYLQNCLVKHDKSISNTFHYGQCYSNSNPNFVDIINNNYVIKSNSSSGAANRGNGPIGQQYSKDLADKNRDSTTPDIGAYEEQ